MNIRKIAIALLVLGAWLAPASQAFATPAPAWKLDASSQSTNFAPGAVSNGENPFVPQYNLIATNVGGAATSGPITITDTLPAGLTPVKPTFHRLLEFPSVSCGSVGQTVTCTTSNVVSPGRWLEVQIPLSVTLPEGSTPSDQATVAGGGASTASVSTTTTISSLLPGFDFLPGAGGFDGAIAGADGSPAVQAGSHPDQLTVDLGFPTVQLPGTPLLNSAAGGLRDASVDLPRGIVVNPASTPKCTEAQLVSATCPDSSQVGTVNVLSFVNGPQLITSDLFNVVPPPGAPAALAFEAANAGIFIHLLGGVRSDSDYGLSAAATDALALGTNPVLAAQTQLWGNPSASSHDSLRGECSHKAVEKLCPVEPRNTPLLTMPSACSGPLTTSAAADGWEEGAHSLIHKASFKSADLAGNLVGVNGCSLLKFEPTLTMRPDVSTAESPTGIHVDLQVPQHKKMNELATSNLKDTKVTFPAGMALNPAAAGGLGACTPAQVGLKTGVGQSPIHFSADPAQCPESSKIGTIEVDTPLLDHPLPGAVYVAQPHNNPFGSLLAVYIAVHDPLTNVVAKFAGKTETDPNTGQLTTTFKENPELPFEDFKVDLFGGPRAALRTPATCGSFTTESEQTPWSGTAPVQTTDSFQVNHGANGSPCASGEAAMPDSPGFEAGTLTPIAGSYSPFLGRLHREDGTQQFKGLNLTLPPGLSGKLAGISTCPDAAINAAGAKTGTEELASPSCPAASQIGEVKVGAGAGPQPYYTTGRIYLAGPYKGGPLSAAVITPAVAGPFDLGTVVVRAPAYVDPTTAQITVKSDPVPRILQGIPLEVRDVRVNLNKPDFTLNPTSCDPMAINGEAISVLGHVTPLSDRFQAGGCRGLDFKPSLSLRLFGKTGRGGHPRLRAILTAKPGEANIASASVALPHSEFLENSHIGSVCTRVQFAADQCPARSVYGHARAITPLLDEALEGPVYLRSSSHELPDLVAALKGPASRPIKVELDGRIDSVNGGIRNTFEVVPDQPVSKFILEMQGAKKGLLVNSRNLCASTSRATARFNGQNGKVYDFRPAMKNDCGKQQQRKGKHRRRHR